MLQVQQLDPNMRPLGELLTNILHSSFYTLLYNVFCPTTDPVLSYSKLDVGHKMNSYTITELEPSSRYLLRLHLVRNNQSVEVSRLRVTTRDQDYIKQHGIRRNYSAIIFTGGRQKEKYLLLNVTVHCRCAGGAAGDDVPGGGGAPRVQDAGPQPRPAHRLLQQHPPALPASHQVSDYSVV